MHLFAIFALVGRAAQGWPHQSSEGSLRAPLSSNHFLCSQDASSGWTCASCPHPFKTKRTDKTVGALTPSISGCGRLWEQGWCRCHGGDGLTRSGLGSKKVAREERVLR